MDHLIHILSSFTNYENDSGFHKGRVRFDLENMMRLCSALGNPQTGIPAVHIAGSKGKGSTALMVTSVLEQLGLKTGTFTSPHLERLNERIALRGVPLSDASFIQAADEVLDVLRRDDALHPTFFEFITAAAMTAFRSAGVETAVYETGLGGRLDSTNVILPEVAVITTVEREHAAILGDTEEKIAFEKAGIIKQGIPVVTAVPEGTPARNVIEKQASCAGATLFAPGCGLAVESRGGQCWVKMEGDRFGPFIPPRPMTLQCWNAACAVAGSRILASRIGIDWRTDSIGRALNGLELPGRFEIREGPPAIVVDGAHTLSSIRASLLEARILCPEKVVTVFGLAADKADQGMVDAVLSLSREVIFTTYSGGRACAPERLRSMGGNLGRTASSPEDALILAKALVKETGLILVTGSFYLAGEVRKLLGL